MTGDPMVERQLSLPGLTCHWQLRRIDQVRLVVPIAFVTPYIEEGRTIWPHILRSGKHLDCSQRRHLAFIGAQQLIPIRRTSQAAKILSVCLVKATRRELKGLSGDAGISAYAERRKDRQADKNGVFSKS